VGKEEETKAWRPHSLAGLSAVELQLVARGAPATVDPAAQAARTLRIGCGALMVVISIVFSSSFYHYHDRRVGEPFGRYRGHDFGGHFAAGDEYLDMFIFIEEHNIIGVSVITSFTPILNRQNLNSYIVATP
jgi:hypothetical protein